ncbi:hypothetical protein [Pararhodobacter sp.]|uniref:hypothetical protein n=1 Tax=Pararhodobacter sp. TaxID=2127056 RepID=UPI002B0030DD|nr:hypothetical protein [Pararhodobacter sp.]
MKPPLYFGSHITRWANLGFDSEAAQIRHQQFRSALDAAETGTQAMGVIRRYVQTERESILASGVPDTDPDIWRVDVMPKYIEWQQ